MDKKEINLILKEGEDKPYIVFRQSEEYLKMTEAEKKVGENREETMGKTREKTGEKIIDFIKINPRISMQELASKMRLSEKGVEWQIKSLKKGGMLERIGQDKGGCWKVLEKQYG